MAVQAPLNAVLEECYNCVDKLIDAAMCVRVNQVHT
jgi:hypothetical protein